jgi:hypothetical protein
MILIGQYDFPFVCRVAIAMRLYGLHFEHRPWSTFGDGDKIAPYNPLRRVPTLVLDSGEVLIESTAILDYLDELVGPGHAMIAERGPERRHALKICALATGLADKAVTTSPSPAHFDSPARPMPACSTMFAIRRSPPTPRAARRCRCLPKSCSRWPRRAGEVSLTVKPGRRYYGFAAGAAPLTPGALFCSCSCASSNSFNVFSLSLPVVDGIRRSALSIGVEGSCSG